MRERFSWFCFCCVLRNQLIQLPHVLAMLCVKLRVVRAAQPNNIERTIVVWVMRFSIAPADVAWLPYKPTVADGIVRGDLRLSLGTVKRNILSACGIV